MSASGRRERVGASVAWEVAKRTTERDREIAWLLYRQKILTTDQLRLLFFSSRRRCQDRLLWLFRHRVIDRFYPAGPFKLGKPQAHWLLDEVGAHLVAARLGRDRKSLVWDRQRDFHAHAHLAHRLECNGFVCSVIAATLEVEDVWVGAWELGWDAFVEQWRRLDCWRWTERSPARPDASLGLGAPDGGVALIAVEWDRATEHIATLTDKISRYGQTMRRAHAPRMNNVCFIVPNEHRAQRLLHEGEQPAKQVPEARFWVTSTTQLEHQGPLGNIWCCLDHEDRRYRMAEFEALQGVVCDARRDALGQRWQRPMPERWAALSPLGVRSRTQHTPAAVTTQDDELVREWERRRAQEHAEAQQAARGLRSAGGSDLVEHPPYTDEREEPWR
ncbi:MAG: replication-relaxation family protein [Solirubrobacteraceae bacterium]